MKNYRVKTDAEGRISFEAKRKTMYVQKVVESSKGCGYFIIDRSGAMHVLPDLKSVPENWPEEERKKLEIIVAEIKRRK